MPLVSDKSRFEVPDDSGNRKSSYCFLLQLVVEVHRESKGRGASSFAGGCAPPPSRNNGHSYDHVEQSTETTTTVPMIPIQRSTNRRSSCPGGGVEMTTNHGQGPKDVGYELDHLVRQILLL